MLTLSQVRTLEPFREFALASSILILIVFGPSYLAYTQSIYDYSGTAIAYSANATLANSKLHINTETTFLTKLPPLPVHSDSILHNRVMTNPILEILPQLGISDVMAKLKTPLSTTDNRDNNIILNVTSPYYVHGIAGKIIKVRGIVTNPNRVNSTSGGLAYISIVDIKEKIPVDLEDWSVEKGLSIPSLDAGQSLPLEWDVRLVKAGSYTVDILFNSNGNLHAPPAVSTKIALVVDPKFNLNPGNVLPVTFGVPAVLMTTLGLVSYLRTKKTSL